MRAPRTRGDNDVTARTEDFGIRDQVIRENPASQGTETSAEVLVGPPWRMVSNAGQQQWYGGYKCTLDGGPMGHSARSTVVELKIHLGYLVITRAFAAPAVLARSERRHAAVASPRAARGRGPTIGIADDAIPRGLL